ncbi:MAG: hypothetical protein HUU20_27175 [Pirellulales bacterium]|nr:hypothetical protein [Pirellulales bacterium]
MAINPQKRQKKLEKRKAKQKSERRQLARRNEGGLPAKLKQAAAAPFLHCFTTDTLWSQGMGQVLVSRQLPGGQVAFGAFLVDRYCMGVKNAFANVVPRLRYQEGMYDKLAARDTLVPLEPASARKLVEGAVQYALDLGISPHPDYRVARLIFGDIEADASTEDFEFGKDGKPLFISGPNDGPARCQQILRTLENRCGHGGFHFMMPFGAMPMQ